MTRIACALILSALIIGCGPKSSDNSSNEEGKPDGVPKATFAKLGIEDKTPGTGPASKKGDYVVVLYQGTFTNGKEFDGNMDKDFKPNTEKAPFAVAIGTGAVIEGWDQGLIGVKEGMVRKLNIPWSMAYGPDGKDKIPPKADLVFYIKTLKVYHAGIAPSIDAVDIKTGSGAKVTAGSTIKFHYISSLLNGKVFDDQSKGLDAQVARLVPGFKESIIGMAAGGERKISFPPNSPNPTGQIPPGQPYQIEVTIDEVK